MPFKIERKFLVVGESWRSGDQGQRYCQGYIARTGGITVRIRRAGKQAYLTIKGEPNGIVRPEFEYEVPVEDAEHMLKALCARPLIEKNRYEIGHGGLVWSVDEFGGENAGLVIAEIELHHPDQTPALPDWVGKEVTHDPRFRNSRLVDDPQGDPASRSESMLSRDEF